MFWFVGYVLMVVLLSPVFTRYSEQMRKVNVADRRRKYHYWHSGSEAQFKLIDSRWDMFYGVLYSFIWPAMLFMLYVRYGAKFPEWREQRRVEVQQKRELELKQAYAMVEQHKRQVMDNFDNALGEVTGGIGKLQRKVEKGRL